MNKLHCIKLVKHSSLKSTLLMFTLMAYAVFYLSIDCNSQNTSVQNLEVMVQLFANGKYEAASTVLEDLAKKHPDNPSIFLWQGRTDFELTRWSEARDAYKRYLELATLPKDKVEAFAAIAKTHREEANCGLAEEWCQKALAIQPNNSDINNLCFEPCEEHDNKNFWNVGLFGICGGGNNWWSWVLGLLIYLPGLLMGSVQTGGFYRVHQEIKNGSIDGAGGISFVMTLIGTAIGFIIFWGIPSSTMKWIVMGSVCLIASGMAWNIATDQSY